MDQFSELRSVGQIDSSEAGRMFREFLRGQVRQSLVNIMVEEVDGCKGEWPTALDRPRRGHEPKLPICTGHIDPRA